MQLINSTLPVHRHPHTAETYLLLRGKIRVMFYSDEKEEIESTLLDPLAGSYGVHIPATSGRHWKCWKPVLYCLK